MQNRARNWRFILCSVVLVATGAAKWIDPIPADDPQVNVPRGPDGEVAPQIGLTAPSRDQVVITPQFQGQAATQSGSSPNPHSPITVARWSFSPAMAGRSVYLSITLEGTQAAIDRMHGDRPLTIQVRWVRENTATAAGSPNLVTDLTVGRPGLAAALEGEVRRQGFFEWHSQAKKDALGPGTWTVSLTYPDGQPLPCGQDAQPCRFTISVG